MAPNRTPLTGTALLESLVERRRLAAHRLGESVDLVRVLDRCIAAVAAGEPVPEDALEALGPDDPHWSAA